MLAVDLFSLLLSSLFSLPHFATPRGYSPSLSRGGSLDLTALALSGCLRTREREPKGRDGAHRRETLEQTAAAAAASDSSAAAAAEPSSTFWTPLQTDCTHLLVF